MALKIGLVLWILTFKAAEEKEISSIQENRLNTYTHKCTV